MMEQSIIIDTRAAVIICPNSKIAAEYITDLLDVGMQGSDGIKLNIETKPTDLVRLFLNGTASAMQVVVKEHQQRKEAPVKKQTVKAKTHKAAKEKPGTNRSIVLECIGKCSKTKAIDCEEICKRTGLKAVNVSPMLTELFKSKRIDRIEGKPLKFFKMEASESEQNKKENGFVVCAARSGKTIPAAECVPNDASPVCRDCEYN